jgi:hypothetical protein
MFDNGERIHKQVPLMGGAQQLTLFLGQTEKIIKKLEC